MVPVDLCQGLRLLPTASGWRGTSANHTPLPGHGQVIWVPASGVVGQAEWGSAYQTEGSDTAIGLPRPASVTDFPNPPKFYFVRHEGAAKKGMERSDVNWTGGAVGTFRCGPEGNHGTLAGPSFSSDAEMKVAFRTLSVPFQRCPHALRGYSRGSPSPWPQQKPTPAFPVPLWPSRLKDAQVYTEVCNRLHCLSLLRAISVLFPAS